MTQTVNTTLEALLTPFSKEMYGWPVIVSLLLLGITGALLTFRTSSLYQRSFTSGRGTADKLTASASTITEDIQDQLDLNKDRQFGDWSPVKFRYPSIEPCRQKLAEIKPIPYRPFRWGAYHVTMGIRSMPWSDWIELDKDHGNYHRIKLHRTQTRGDKVVRVLGDEMNPLVKGGAEAAVELVHELAEYLSRRYPGEFQIVRHSQRVSTDEPPRPFCDWGWEDLPPVKTITITALGVSYDLPLSVDDGSRAPERAMEIAGLLIQDDLALMVEGVDGLYYFQAGSICLSGFWRMEDKIGLKMEDIHIRGNVPQYKERLHASLERFFRRLPVDKPVIRNNYFVQANRPDERESGARKESEVDPEELSWAGTSLGDEDAFKQGTHGTSEPEGAAQRGEAKVDWIRLRSERQTLRRLARSGAVVFTIRTYMTPIVDLGQERGVPGRMASALRSWTADVGEYKGKERGGWWEPMLEYLDARHAEQLGRGEIGEEDADEKRREKRYPF